MTIDVKRGLAALIVVAAVAAATPARAQFEEPDTTRLFAVGPLLEIDFRGGLGTVNQGALDLDLSNGPFFGARFEFRATRTFWVGFRGSFGRTQEKFETGGTGRSDTALGREMSQIQGSGELYWRLKPQVPGYFLLGAGLRHTSTDAGDVGFLDPNATFNEPFAVTGAGLDLVSKNRNIFRVELRLYFLSPEAKEGVDTGTLTTDFAVGLSYLREI